MATTKLGLPTITGNMTADVVRDLNALAEAVDGKAGAAGGLARLDANGKVINADGSQSGEVTQEEFSGLEQTVTTHLADDVKHITGTERNNWNSKANGNHNHNGVYEPVLPTEQKRRIFIQSTAPTNPQEGDIWIEV